MIGRQRAVAVALLGGLAILGSVPSLAWARDGVRLHASVDVPGYPWADLYFRHIDELTQGAGMRRLRDRAALGGDVEVRVWRFSRAPVHGTVLRREAGRWSAQRVDEVFRGRQEPAAALRLEATTFGLEAPEGWEAFWEQLRAVEPNAGTAAPGDALPSRTVELVAEVWDGEHYSLRHRRIDVVTPPPDDPATRLLSAMTTLRRTPEPARHDPLVPPSAPGDRAQSAAPPAEPWVTAALGQIDEAAALVPLPPLREGTPPAGDLEARLWWFEPWEGRRYSGHLNALRLVRHDGKWRGTGLWSARAPDTPEVEREARVRGAQVRPGFAATWERIVSAGLLTLPDATRLHGERRVTRGVTFVVEVSCEGRYRAYHYSDPERQSWPEARSLREALSLVDASLADQAQPRTTVSR